MTYLHRLPLALIALGAATPAFAHEAEFLHNHAEGLAVAAIFAVAAGGTFAWKMLAKRSRK